MTLMHHNHDKNNNMSGTTVEKKTMNGAMNNDKTYMDAVLNSSMNTAALGMPCGYPCLRRLALALARVACACVSVTPYKTLMLLLVLL